MDKTTKRDLWVLIRQYLLGAVILMIALTLLGAKLLEAIVISLLAFTFAGYFMWFIIRPSLKGNDNG